MFANLFHRSPADDPCRLPADLRIYEVESNGTYSQTAGGRENTEYRNTYATGVCTYDGTLWGERGQDCTTIDGYCISNKYLSAILRIVVSDTGVCAFVKEQEETVVIYK